ncbi:hypothetical protein SMJ63A_10400 [Stenotrophomonas geniculata]
MVDGWSNSSRVWLDATKSEQQPSIGSALHMSNAATVSFPVLVFPARRRRPLASFRAQE